MIIIPEKEIVLITPPRTGSTSLSDQVAARYPMSFRPYRHMEADGIPFGYDRWRRIGIFREPLSRLWSVYHYCKSVAISERGTPQWRAKVMASVSASFDQWVTDNAIVFTDPFDSAGTRYWPRYAVRSPIPENRKSLFIYLRPDLGTEIMSISGVLSMLDLDPEARKNGSDCPEAPSFANLSPHTLQHIKTFFEWDIQYAAWAQSPQPRDAGQ